MAKVKITGHASGTGVLTITAPNTSTDRTITLPDATGTLLNSDGSGANLTNLPADATKLPLTGGTMTGNLGLTTSADSKIIITSGNSSNGQIRFDDAAGTDRGRIHYEHSNDSLIFNNNAATNLTITSDGRGLSQFTAKAWCRFNGGGTPAFSDSHNCSSLGDWGTGSYGVYMTTGPANTNYSVVCLVNDAKYGSLNTSNTAPQGGRFDIEVRTVDSNFGAEDVSYVSCLVFGD